MPIIHITRKDINLGQRGSGCDCPIALGTIRSLGLGSSGFVLVGNTVMLTSTEIYDLPWIAQRFIRAFDLDRKVRPFKFEVTSRDKNQVS